MLIRAARGQGLLAVALSGCALLAAAGAVEAQQPLEPAEYVVVLRRGPRDIADARALGAAHGARHVYSAVFPGFAARLPGPARAALARDPRVELIEPAAVVRAWADLVPAGVDRIDADRAQAAGHTGPGARVAIVDTGIDLDHPDLRDRVDRGLSRTFVSWTRSTRGGDDDHGHGTHVAGTVAATANGADVLGVAPGATLVSLKVLSRNGSGLSTDIIAALDWITDHNRRAASYADMIHVANFSLGGSGSDTDTAYRRAFEACAGSGCLVVAAAGNSGSDAAGFVPAAYECVLTVSAMDPRDDTFASWSNWGRDVDVAAPGVSVLSDRLGGGTTTLSGTSMAAPHVAGAAALYVGSNLGTLDRAGAVDALRSALLGAGEYVTLRGDPDGVAEPLVDAEALFGPAASPPAAVVVDLRSDAASYPEGATVARLTCRPTDEAGRAIGGLGDGAFAASVDAAARDLAWSEASSGVYEADLPLGDLSLERDHLVEVVVTDGRDLSGVGALTLRRSGAGATIFVAAIGYQARGPHLDVWLRVEDAGGAPVAGAQVDVDVSLNGAPLGGGTGALTGADGVASYRISKAAPGTYRTEVRAVTKEGATHDPTRDFADPGYTK